MKNTTDHTLLENNDDKEKINQHVERSSNEIRNNNLIEASINTSNNGCIERIEDRRYSLNNLGKEKDRLIENELSKRAFSENDVSFKDPIKKISLIKNKIEEKIISSGKICKECFVHSIQSQLSMLGIVSASNRNSDVLEDAEIANDMTECNSLLETTNEGECSTESNHEGLIKSLHRRTLSEIDWHELTRFAQGEFFEPESSTAKEIRRVMEEGKDELSTAFKLMQNMDFDFVVEEAEKCVQCVINTGWRVVSHWELPQWLRDNDFLWHMHRPQLPSMKECFCSMFRIHTETGNIWTHFVGLILVVVAMLFLYLRPSTDLGDFPKGWEEYLVFTAFFIGAITCLMFSWLYHTCSCHSKKTSKLFSKLDYTGISCMIMGSFVPCIYYGFYCQFYEKLIYSVCVTVLGIASIIVALWDKFATPAFRPIRAGVFLALGCSGVVPVIHMLTLYGVHQGAEQGAVGWLALMGVCYIIGAVLYAMRVPERFFPGKCNLMFQSHQIFHVLVVLAAFIHLHGCCEMASYRMRAGRNCSAIIPVAQTFPNSTINSSF